MVLRVVSDCVIRVTLLRAAGDRDGSAVHVHFSVPNLVEPSPCERVVAWCYIFWN